MVAIEPISELWDSALLAEIELLGDLMEAAAQTSDHLSQPKIDHALRIGSDFTVAHLDPQAVTAGWPERHPVRAWDGCADGADSIPHVGTVSGWRRQTLTRTTPASTSGQYSRQ